MSANSAKSLRRILGIPLTLSFAEFGALDVGAAGTAEANKAIVLGASKDIATITSATITTLTTTTVNASGTVTFGTLGTTGIGGKQSGVTGTALTKNADAAYANVVGLSATLVAGATYRFRAVLPSTVASGTGGIKYAFKYTTATLTSIEATAKGYTASAVAVQHTTTTTDQADLFTQAAVVLLTEIEGTLVVNAAGTLNIQMAQNTSNASNTVALVGGTLEFTRIA